jgi:integration host factor subunit alpha
MIKSDIIEIICEKVGLLSKESAEIVDRLFDILKETLEAGEKIRIARFGNFVVRQKRREKDGIQRRVKRW